MDWEEALRIAIRDRAPQDAVELTTAEEIAFAILARQERIGYVKEV